MVSCVIHIPLQDISAKFKVAEDAKYLVYKAEWLSSSDADGLKDFRVLTSKQFNASFASE